MEHILFNVYIYIYNPHIHDENVNFFVKKNDSVIYQKKIQFFSSILSEPSTHYFNRLECFFVLLHVDDKIGILTKLFCFGFFFLYQKAMYYKKRLVYIKKRGVNFKNIYSFFLIYNETHTRVHKRFFIPFFAC